MTTADGTESYTYDALNRLTEVSYPGGPTVTYAYDAAGNRSSETRGGTTTNSTYDNTGQLTAVGGATYNYDANGNLTSAGSKTFAWDFDNRLTSATVAGTTASYRYDGDGVRTRSTINGAATDLLVDRSGGLPTVVDDGSAAYLHASGLISKVTGSGATWALNDAIGSVRGLTDGAGSLTGSASYEAFGAPRVATGASTMFGFAGEPTDATGLVNLRARSLDPTTGRFLSADTVSPNAPGTGGYNLYAYVANNPTTWVDPSGHAVVAVGVYALALLFSGVSLTALGVSIAVLILGFIVVSCALDDVCLQQAMEDARVLDEQGSVGQGIQTLSDEWQDWVGEHPEEPTVEEPEPRPIEFPLPPGLGDAVPVDCNQGITITEFERAHVNERHVEGMQLPKWRQESYFYSWVDWERLAILSEPIPARRRPVRRESRSEECLG